MRDLIRKTLREYSHPVLVYELTISSNILDEKFIRVLGGSSDKMELSTNYHSETAIGAKSKLQRVDIESIDSTISDFEEEFIFFTKEVVKFCDATKRDNCGFIFIDDPNGFEFHVWLNFNRKDRVEVVINTSIYHPYHLPNRRNDPVLLVDRSGEIYLPKLNKKPYSG